MHRERKGIHIMPLTSNLSVFLGVALRRPGVVGAVLPSSRGLAKVLASVVPTSGKPTVLELGPGTGAVSSVISEQLPSGSSHFAVEIDPNMADHLERTQPTVSVLRGDAAKLDKLLAEHDVTQVDAVISGLPWSLFSEEQQRKLLSQISQAIAPDAAFSTFAYRHALSLAGAKLFRSLLHVYFADVVVTRTVWRNFPPAIVYICRNPIRENPDV